LRFSSKKAHWINYLIGRKWGAFGSTDGLLTDNSTSSQQIVEAVADVKNAFLHGEVDRERYMEQPDGRTKISQSMSLS